MQVRFAQMTDLPDLERLAGLAGVGLTTLPQNRDLLAERIADSVRSLGAEVSLPGPENYLFVLEHQGQVQGTAALFAAVGTQEAFYNYRVGLSVFASRELDVYQRVPTLYLSNDLTGATELATLFVAPSMRGSGAAQLLSAARYLFMAAHPQRFSETVIAELRGWADAAGQSPFWDGLGRHFFSMEFSRADRLSSQTRAFIAELMPQHPLYTVLLPEAAREAIAQVHPETRAARRLLEAQGFRYNGYVDIFDAGPVVAAQREQILALQQVQAFGTDGARPDQAVFLAQGQGAEFTVRAGSAAKLDGDLTPIRGRQAPAWILDQAVLRAPTTN